jgi:hypothetical protein
MIDLKAVAAGLKTEEPEEAPKERILCEKCGVTYPDGSSCNCPQEKAEPLAVQEVQETEKPEVQETEKQVDPEKPEIQEPEKKKRGRPSKVKNPFDEQPLQVQTVETGTNVVDASEKVEIVIQSTMPIFPNQEVPEVKEVVEVPEVKETKEEKPIEQKIIGTIVKKGFSTISTGQKNSWLFDDEEVAKKLDLNRIVELQLQGVFVKRFYLVQLANGKLKEVQTKYSNRKIGETVELVIEEREKPRKPGEYYSDYFLVSEV